LDKRGQYIDRRLYHHGNQIHNRSHRD
jgi:hypothetical protein